MAALDAIFNPQIFTLKLENITFKVYFTIMPWSVWILYFDWLVGVD